MKKNRAQWKRRAKNGQEEERGQSGGEVQRMDRKMKRAEREAMNG
jgi:hypothetical protein